MVIKLWPMSLFSLQMTKIQHIYNFKAYASETVEQEYFKGVITMDILSKCYWTVSSRYIKYTHLFGF